MNMSGNQRGLIPAFFISAVIIAEHVQMSSVLFRGNYLIMTVGKIT